MNKCAEIMVQISAYADGELSGSDALRVETHIAECARCAALLDSYRAISDAVNGAEETVPDALMRGVMARIAEEPALRPARGKKLVRAVLTRYIPAAACIALILLAAPRFPELGCASAPQYTSSSPMSGGSAMADRNAGDHYYEADAGGGITNNDIAAAPPAGAPEDSAYDTAVQEALEEAAPSEAPAQTDVYLTGGESEGGVGPYDYSGYYAVIKIAGTLPDGFDAFDKEDAGNGVTRLFVTAETALRLIGAGFDAVLYDETAETAVVLWSGS